VRILATQADKPYAAPGDTVRMQILAFDGRTTKQAPMRISWLPQPCFDPPSDAYYACYRRFGEVYRPGIDLTPQLEAGTSFSFQMAADVITSHGGANAGDPYGMAVVFSFACAGHVQYIEPPTGAPPDALPFGCFDAAGAQLGTDAFVFAYSTVYAFTGRQNANPVLQGLVFGGPTVDPTTGISVQRCDQSDINNCPSVSLDVVVPDSSDETDPGDLDANGNPLKEEIYVDYFLNAGKVKDDTVVLLDPRAGRLTNTANSLYAPQETGSFLLWAVIHDNRGGVAWQQVPLTAQ
jgi:hypothetical protein